MSHQNGLKMEEERILDFSLHSPEGLAIGVLPFFSHVLGKDGGSCKILWLKP